MANRVLAVGSDYETFVRRISDDKIVSAIPLIPGDKDNHQILRTCSVHHDNILAEVNIRPVSRTNEFAQVVCESLADLDQYLSNTGHTYMLKDSAYMEEKELWNQDATEFGCEPDYDVLSGEEMEPPSAHLAENFRAAGGHIHVSYTFGSEEQYMDTALMLSMALSLGTTVMGDGIERRSIYGKAGRVRFKEYGVEVRSPSNVWLKHKQWMRWVSKASHYVVSNCMRPATITKLKINYPQVLNAINNCDRIAAARFITMFFKGLDLPESEETIQYLKYAVDFGGGIETTFRKGEIVPKYGHSAPFFEALAADDDEPSEEELQEELSALLDDEDGFLEPPPSTSPTSAQEEAQSNNFFTWDFGNTQAGQAWSSEQEQAPTPHIPVDGEDSE